jgi:phage/plasmid primase-like uncharacterized protein
MALENGYNFDAIKAMHPIADVIGNVVNLRRSGREWKGICPFHSEKSPSFTVYKERYHCFGCGAGGDVVDFIENIENISRADAIAKLTGGDAPRMTPALKKKLSAQKTRRDEKLALEHARARLEAQRRWDAAPVLEGEHPYLTKKGIAAYECRTEGNKLVLPIYDDEGEIMSVQTIAPDSDKRFHTGAKVMGGRCNIGIHLGRTIICEGFATGASIFESVVDQVCIAFSKANIHVIAREFAANGVPFIIAADTNAVAEMQDLARELKVLVVAPECGSDFNDQHKERGEESVRKTFADAMVAWNIESTQIEDAAESEANPVDLWATHEPPPLPRGLLPKEIEDFAFILADVMGADAGGLAMAALACCGSMIDDRIRLKVKKHERWTESARIWVTLVGGPSVLKSPVMRAAGSHIARLDSERVRDYTATYNKWMQDKSDGMKENPPQPIERLRINDATVEAAQEILKNTPRGILCIQDELAGWFASMERNSKGKGGDNSFWLQAFNGGHFSVDRVGRGAVSIENLSVSLIGGIQPDKIRGIMSEAADDGMMQRFFPIVLRDSGYDKDVETPDVSEKYETLLDQLYAMEPPQSFIGELPLTFDEGAQQYRSDLARQHVDMVGVIAHANGKIASHIGKYNGLFARLCVIWHCIEHADSKNPPEAVTEATARKVGQFMHEYLFRHLKAFYTGVLGMSDDLEVVRDLAGFILAHNKESVTMRELQRSTRALKHLDRFQGARIFEQLEAFGWLEQVHKRSDAPQWLVNPKVHELYNEKAKSERERRDNIKADISKYLGKD